MRGILSPPAPCRPVPLAALCLRTEGRISSHVPGQIITYASRRHYAPVRGPCPSRLRRETRTARGDNSVRLAFNGNDPAHHLSVGRGASRLDDVEEDGNVEELREAQ